MEGMTSSKIPKQFSEGRDLSGWIKRRPAPPTSQEGRSVHTRARRCGSRGGTRPGPQDPAPRERSQAGGTVGHRGPTPGGSGSDLEKPAGAPTSEGEVSDRTPERGVVFNGHKGKRVGRHPPGKAGPGRLGAGAGGRGRDACAGSRPQCAGGPLTPGAPGPGPSLCWTGPALSSCLPHPGPVRVAGLSPPLQGTAGPGYSPHAPPAGGVLRAPGHPPAAAESRPPPGNPLTCGAWVQGLHLQSGHSPVLTKPGPSLPLSFKLNDTMLPVHSDARALGQMWEGDLVCQVWARGTLGADTRKGTLRCGVGVRKGLPGTQSLVRGRGEGRLPFPALSTARTSPHTR